jgi:hypothetical protein
MDVTHVTPGPIIGNILNALMEEVLDNPALNTPEYLENRAIGMSKMTFDDLAKLAEIGRNKKDEVENKNIDQIHKKYHVS